MLPRTSPPQSGADAGLRPRPNQERPTLAGGASPLLVALSSGAGLRMAGK